jgi:hypothetical protein
MIEIGEFLSNMWCLFLIQTGVARIWSATDVRGKSFVWYQGGSVWAYSGAGIQLK